MPSDDQLPMTTKAISNTPDAGDVDCASAGDTCGSVAAIVMWSSCLTLFATPAWSSIGWPKSISLIM